MKISVLILTKNEEQNLPACLASVSWSNDIHVLDSFSEDGTIDIALKSGASVTQRIFDDWSTHQNWALKNIPFKNDWVFYIDADERVSEELKHNLISLKSDEDIVAYSIRRRDFSWNEKWLKHVQMSPWYLRLFRPGKLHYERLVNPFPVADGKTGKMPGYIDHYPFSKGYSHWWRRHVEYAALEARERYDNEQSGRSFSLRKALFNKDFHKKRYHQKGIFYKLPARPLIKFVYLSIWKLGFLDGRDGIRYAVMQSIYEYFIILQTKELQKQKAIK